MRSENAPVGVHLVDDDEVKVPEKVRPIGVVGQDAGVQHIRVGEDDIGTPADGRAVGLGSIAVVDG